MSGYLASCNDATWYQYFAENMDAFRSVRIAVQNLGAVALTIEKLGAGTSLRAVVGGTFFGEKLILAAGGLGTMYIGAAIGSTATATGRYLGCGTSFGEALYQLSRLYPRHRFPKTFVRAHPEVVLPGNSRRRNFRSRAGHELRRAS